MDDTSDWSSRLRRWVRIALAIDPRVKAALVLAVALLASVAINAYFSPYQSCVRAFTSDDGGAHDAQRRCAYALGGRR
ncbi:MAG: hypothetical protein KF755_13445 [Burkholderiaceae bacterium]|nr:hypothetical protein [Burkholderiaceae bacterium]